jgi:predicted nucleic acid-binding Zn ribbon protein
MDAIKKFCHRCGTPIQMGDIFCRNCGTKVTDFQGNTDKKKQKTIILASVIGLLVIAALIVGIAVGTSGGGNSSAKNTGGRNISSLDTALLGEWDNKVNSQSSGFHYYFSNNELYFVPQGSNIVYRWAYRYLDSNEKGNWIKIDIYYMSGGQEEHYKPVVLQFSADRNSFITSEGTQFPNVRMAGGDYIYTDSQEKPDTAGKRIVP